MEQTQFDSFVLALQNMMNEHYARTYPNLTPPTMTVDEGTVYNKVVRNDSSGSSCSVYAFVKKSTGEIFKPAGWKAPAKKARGNVNSPKNGMECCGPYSVAYLR